MKLSELIAEAKEALSLEGDQEVFVVDGYDHYSTKWCMLMPEDYGRTPKGFYVRLRNPRIPQDAIRQEKLDRNIGEG